MHTANAVLGIKPREYEKLRTKAHQIAQIFRAVALSQFAARDNSVKYVPRHTFQT